MKNVKKNLVEYVTATGERVEARLVRPGRFDAVFEVAGCFEPLHASQALPSLKIKSGRRALYQGCATVCRLVDTDAGLLCGVALDEGGISLEMLPSPETLNGEASVSEWLTPDGLMVVASMNDSKPFRYFIEFRLDGHRVHRHNRFMASPCPNLPGAATEVLTEPTTVNLPDRSLIQRIVAYEHDAAAAEALVVRHRSDMHALVAREPKRPGIRENWLRVLRGAWAGFRGTSQFRTIFFRVAMNVINEWRRKSRWHEFAGPAAQGCGQWRNSFWAAQTGGIHG